MANINDFKIVSQKSKKYFDLLVNVIEPKKKIIKDKEQERFGFYLFTLEAITGKKDVSDLVELITDQDFNIQFLGENFDDLGVDAINIDEEEKTIQLFNFKYRERFGGEKSTINDAIISTKFINAISSANTDGLNGRIKEKANLIIEEFDSKEIWKLHLYIVSNDDFKTKNETKNLDRLKTIYGLEIFNIGLSQLSEFVSLTPKSIDAELVLDKDAVMSFSEDTLSTSKSYIIRLPLCEIIRITCDNENIRKDYNIEDMNKLNNVSLDFSVLFDNVRGFIIKSKFNQNIINTLKEDPTRFFIYNNGLTLTVKDIEANLINGNKKLKFKLKGIQVLNGGQTLRTIHNFAKFDVKNIEGNLSDAQVSLRIFKISSDNDLNNKIAEFTNSQNAISNIDLKSLRSEQLQLEQYLSEHDILYVRKYGDTGGEDREYKYRISMEKFGQILFSIKGYPEKATNQKQNIFDKYYNDLFGVKNLKIDEVPKQIKKYFEIKNIYENTINKPSDQKIFYILYLSNKLGNEKLEDLINSFEEKIQGFTTEKELSDARKLITNDFKDYIDKEFQIDS